MSPPRRRRLLAFIPQEWFLKTHVIIESEASGVVSAIYDAGQAIAANDVDRLLALKRDAVLTPSWQTWHGMNDRFAFAPPLMAARFGNRIALVKRFVADRPMHSETFARYAMVDVHKASLELTHMRGLRMRANGEIAENDRCLEVECGPGKKRCASGCQNSDD